MEHSGVNTGPGDSISADIERSVLKAAAGAAAIATAQFPILGANDRIRVGQVGLGGRGTNHIQFYSSLDSDCQIVGLAGRDFCRDIKRREHAKFAFSVRRSGDIVKTEWPSAAA